MAQEDNMAEAEWRIAKALKERRISLNLSSLKLGALPESIGQLSRLDELFLSSNQLSSLPKSIGQLSQLRRLVLSRNHLSSLSESIDRLSQLHVLSLNDNQLKSLPASIGQLSQLRVLLLQENLLSSLPESMLQLASLEKLFLHGNEGLGLPAEVLGPTYDEVARYKTPPANPADILAYYFRLRGGRRTLNEVKLILVGRGKVGKTSLVHRLVRDHFDPFEAKTEGICITQWPVKLNGKEDVRLHVWDFGGQEIMHATHQFFLTERSLYLLVLNGREGGEDADAEYWLKLISSFGGDSPVIVVLNKIKEHPFDLNRRGLQQKYPAVREFIRTDCADRTGIDDLRQVVERETDRLLGSPRVQFPSSWFSIKDRLSEMSQKGENYLSFDSYRAVCAERGEKETEAQDKLAGYLHCLGIALNYKDDPRLRDKHVLNPHWVTQGIYQLLNAKALEAQRGDLRVHDLGRILPPRDYPPEMHGFLLNLMKKFELCFSFPDQDERYLVPELLPKEEPDLGDEFRAETALCFQYHYPILPEGLLPRFIVRTHVLSENLPRWRTGVVLQFEGARALVKADVQDRKVMIAVVGSAASRRRLLAVIRSDFERIHHSIKELKPQEMVPVPAHPEVLIPYRKLLLWEEKGKPTIEEEVGDEIFQLNVRKLLGDVDLAPVSRITARRELEDRPLRLFYSYSHKDEALRNELETHLKLLERLGHIESWHDRRIDPADDWREHIDENLERADIILLLVSPDFIYSDFCYKIEMERALQRHQDGGAETIPVILRHFSWQKAPFAHLQVLPKDGLAVMSWPNRDAAWCNVAEGIEKVVERRRAGRRKG